MFGNLILVTEPDPNTGLPATVTTSYAYDWLNQLTTVTQTRGSVTQTRSYVYSGSDLTSETNPENGTVNYVYNSAHQLTSKTDAIGQQTQYDYDAYGRTTEIRYYDQNSQERTSERVHYYYVSV